MSLSDLRKKPSPSDRRQLSVDEFIEQANNYANGGLNNIVVLHPVKKPKKVPFRKATFTLSEECINALTQLAQQTGLSKSALVRKMIQQTNLKENSNESSLQKEASRCSKMV